MQRTQKEIEEIKQRIFDEWEKICQEKRAKIKRRKLINKNKKGLRVRVYSNVISTENLKF